MTRKPVIRQKSPSLSPKTPARKKHRTQKHQNSAPDNTKKLEKIDENWTRSETEWDAFRQVWRNIEWFGVDVLRTWAFVQPTQKADFVFNYEGIQSEQTSTKKGFLLSPWLLKLLFLFSTKIVDKNCAFIRENIEKEKNIFNGGDNLPFQLGLPAAFLAKGKIRSRTDHFRERIQFYVQSHCHFNFEMLLNNRLFLLNTVRTFKKHDWHRF